MKAETLANILRQLAERHNAHGNLLPAGEDAVPYAIAEAFTELADELEFVEDQ
jgi:hypothetical protein